MYFKHRNTLHTPQKYKKIAVIKYIPYFLPVVYILYANDLHISIYIYLYACMYMRLCLCTNRCICMYVYVYLMFLILICVCILSSFHPHNHHLSHNSPRLMFLFADCATVNKVYLILSYLIIKCRMKSLIHSQTSTVAPLKFGNG